MMITDTSLIRVLVKLHMEMPSMQASLNKCTLEKTDNIHFIVWWKNLPLPMPGTPARFTSHFTWLYFSGGCQVIMDTHNHHVA